MTDDSQISIYAFNFLHTTDKVKNFNILICDKYQYPDVVPMTATKFTIETSQFLKLLVTNSEPISKFLLSVTILFTFIEVLHLNAANFNNLAKLKHHMLKRALCIFKHLNRKANVEFKLSLLLKKGSSMD